MTARDESAAEFAANEALARIHAGEPATNLVKVQWFQRGNELVGPHLVPKPGIPEGDNPKAKDPFGRYWTLFEVAQGEAGI